MVDRKSLTLPAVLLIGTPHQVVVQVLIDTGAEVDLIRPGLKSIFRPASKRLVLRAANGMVLRGGSHTVEFDLACKGYRVHDGSPSSWSSRQCCLKPTLRVTSF